jgi:predicted porin
MKKSLFALATVGAFAGAAQAQSSVTVYGIMDHAVVVDGSVGGGNNIAGAIYSGGENSGLNNASHPS